MKKLMICFTLLSSAYSFASVDCDTLNDKFMNKYHSEFNIKWKNQNFPCPSISEKIAKAFYHLDKIELNKNKHGFAPDFYEYVKKAPSFRYRTKDTNYPNMKVVASASKGGPVTIFKNFASQTEVYAVNVLVHETRHTEQSDPRHAVCKFGRSKGKYACDQKFNSGALTKGGAYNMGFLFFWWLRDASYNHDLSKSLAHTYMKSSVLNRFNEISKEDVARFSGSYQAK